MVFYLTNQGNYLLKSLKLSYFNEWDVFIVLASQESYIPLPPGKETTFAAGSPVGYESLVADFHPIKMFLEKLSLLPGKFPAHASR